MKTEKYDFIIIGGGSAGCVLAHRLSENPSAKILVLEAGPMDHAWDFRLHMPTALAYPLKSKTYNWAYDSESEPFMKGRKIHQPRGRVLGGSSSINGMIWIRGHSADFDHWAKHEGLSDWDYAHCLPYFKKLEHRLIGGDDFRGSEGPLKLTTPQCKNPLFDAFFSSVKEAGYPLTKDVNGCKQEGFGVFDQTIYKGRRHSAARAYLHPVLERKNLELKTKALVSRVLIRNNVAEGVEFKHKGTWQKAYAQEVILASGAINSPQLLQLSGVGPKVVLEKNDIPLHLDLPGVGENLQDHLEVYVQWACKQNVSLYPMLNPLRAPCIGYEWLFHKKGIGASNHFEAGGFVKTDEEQEFPNLQFHFLPLAIRYDGSSPIKGHGFQLHVGPTKSDATGHVRISSKDPSSPPKILFNYLSTQKDRKEWCQSIRIARKLIETKAMDEFRGEALSPGNEVQSDEEILNFIAEEGESAYHPSCTCKMGVTKDSVVDPELRVHGIRNLRVVDASVMPEITNGNIYAPTLMIAEKASDLILGNSPLEPLIYDRPRT